MNKSKKVAIIGAGAWGSALACVASRAGNTTWIWSRSSKIAEEINTRRRNQKYLDDLPLESEITASDHLETVLVDAELVVLAVPAQTIRSVSKQISSYLNPDTPVTSAAKGIDRDAGLTPSALIEKSMPSNPIAVLSGPGFAYDVVQGMPTAVTVASARLDVAKRVSEQLSALNFRCYATDDVVGVELGGALKNVLALAVGAARGMGLGASAEAALIARGFSEITRIASKLGANPITLTGLSGIGDIVLTCSNELSRNFQYGIAMGRESSLSGLKLAEGAFTAKIAESIARSEGVNAPIIHAVNAVLDGKLSAKQAVVDLLDRPLKTEN